MQLIKVVKSEVTIEVTPLQAQIYKTEGRVVWLDEQRKSCIWTERGLDRLQIFVRDRRTLFCEYQREEGNFLSLALGKQVVFTRCQCLLEKLDPSLWILDLLQGEDNNVIVIIFETSNQKGLNPCRSSLLTQRNSTSVKGDNHNFNEFECAILSFLDEVSGTVIKIIGLREFSSESQQWIYTLLLEEIGMGCIDISIKGGECSSKGW